MATQLNEISLKSCHRLLENKDHPSSSPLNTCETLQGISLLQIRAECCFLEGEQTSYLLKIINSLLGQDPAKAGLESLTQGERTQHSYRESTTATAGWEGGKERKTATNVALVLSLHLPATTAWL